MKIADILKSGKMYLISLDKYKIGKKKGQFKYLKFVNLKVK